MSMNIVPVKENDKSEVGIVDVTKEVARFKRMTELFALYSSNGAISRMIECIDTCQDLRPEEREWFRTFLIEMPGRIKTILVNTSYCDDWLVGQDLGTDVLKDNRKSVFESKARVFRGVKIGEKPYDFSIMWAGCGISFARETWEYEEMEAKGNACDLPNGSFFTRLPSEKEWSESICGIRRPLNIANTPPGIYFMPSKKGYTWETFAPTYVVPWIQSRPGVVFNVQDNCLRDGPYWNWKAYYRRIKNARQRNVDNYAYLPMVDQTYGLQNKKHHAYAVSRAKKSFRKVKPKKVMGGQLVDHSIERSESQPYPVDDLEDAATNLSQYFKCSREICMSTLLMYKGDVVAAIVELMQ